MKFGSHVEGPETHGSTYDFFYHQNDVLQRGTHRLGALIGLSVSEPKSRLPDHPHPRRHMPHLANGRYQVLHLQWLRQAGRKHVVKDRQDGGTKQRSSSLKEALERVSLRYVMYLTAPRGCPHCGKATRIRESS